MSGSPVVLTWRQVAHTSRPPTQEPKLRRWRWMDLRTGKQEEEVMVVRGGEYRCQTNETSRRGKGKGTGGKGEHEGKGGFGSEGIHQVTNIMTDEAEKEEVNQRDDGECREDKYERDLRRLEEKRRGQEEHEQRQCGGREA